MLSMKKSMWGGILFLSNSPTSHLVGMSENPSLTNLFLARGFL